MKARVLFVDHSAVLGGGELSLLDISRGFRETSTVLLLSDGPFREVLQEEGVPVRLLGAGASVLSIKRSGGGRSPTAVASIAGLAWRLAQVAREFDVLYANSQKAFVVSALAGGLARRPVIWHLRDILCEAHFGRANIRLVTVLANVFASRVIANSQATANAFLAQRGRAGKIRVVHNGIDARDFVAVTDTEAREVRIELGVEGRQLVGVFGRFHPWKGQHVAVDVLSRLPDVHALFVGGALFGEHDYVAEIRRRVREAGMEDRVHFLGFRRDLPRLMRAVDVVLHTAQAPEPFGRVIVEGMLATRPVVAADAGGAAEIVRHGSTGLLVPPGDVGAFAEAVAGLLADPALRATLGRAGHERAIRDFSVDAMLAGVAGEIAAATGEDRSASPTASRSCSPRRNRWRG
jgi:glycosyltransferase involved in cell wall biosynthesis